jgi:4-amino-4-deoxy-L-arabinose transferase-like glycosyltransferase
MPYRRRSALIHPTLKPFLVTALQAAKMPRWLLLLMCVLYVVPGLVGRDPWRSEDAVGFGVAWTMSLATRGGADWLLPNVLGVPVIEEGPLPFWLGAIAIRALPFLAPDTVVRGVAMAWLALLLTCLWYACWLLARRPEAQPTDPFGASATRSDYGRAVADSALLVTLATFGLLARAHETTAESAQVAWIAVFLYGCALSLERPRLGGALTGLAIGLTVMSRGLPDGAALSVAALALPALVGSYRLVARPMLAALVPAALASAAAWPLALVLSGDVGSAHLSDWLGWNLAQVAQPDSLGYLVRNAPWFFWPAWPLAAWALWRWRDRRRDPTIAVPALTGAALLVVAMLAPRGTESSLLPIVPPMALLAALGLPTIRRGFTSLIDWFAVVTFTLSGFVLWAYWIAFQTGWPPKMAFRAQQSALGFVPTLDPLALALGVAATIAWLALVVWRVSRQPKALWRSMVLSSGGMVLTWVLLMTLWLPAGNHRKTYRDVAQQAGAVVAPGHRCVRTLGMDVAQRASFGYFGAMRFDDARDDCEWLLVADRVSQPIAPAGVAGDWRQAWRGQRPVDRQERFRLFRRVGG